MMQVWHPAFLPESGGLLSTGAKEQGMKDVLSRQMARGMDGSEVVGSGLRESPFLGANSERMSFRQRNI